MLSQRTNKPEKESEFKVMHGGLQLKSAASRTR